MTNNEALMARLGKVFSKENIEQLSNALDEAELPIVPPDITLGETQTLLAYHGNLLACLYPKLRVLEASLSNKEDAVEILVGKTIKQLQDANRNLKVTEVKTRAASAPAVIEAKRAVCDARYALAKTKGIVEALEAQNINLRKLASTMQSSMENDIT